MNGPKVYAELSSVAKDFLAREYKVERPKVAPPYEYLSAGLILLQEYLMKLLIFTDTLARVH